MPEPLSKEDFEMYYRNTYFEKDGVVYFVHGFTDTGLALRHEKAMERTTIVNFRDILDYIGKYPQAGYRNFSEFDCRYVSFGRDGTKKGPTRNSIIGAADHDFIHEIVFKPTFPSVEEATAKAFSNGAISAISFDMMMAPHRDKICLFWKGQIIGRVTRHGKAILSSQYTFLKDLICDTIDIGDIR